MCCCYHKLCECIILLPLSLPPSLPPFPPSLPSLSPSLLPSLPPFPPSLPSLPPSPPSLPPSLPPFPPSLPPFTSTLKKPSSVSHRGLSAGFLWPSSIHYQTTTLCWHLLSLILSLACTPVTCLLVQDTTSFSWPSPVHGVTQ